MQESITNIDFLGLSVTLLLGLLTVLAPRRYAPVPILTAVCFIPLAQKLVVADLDFTMVRIVILFGWARLVLRGEIRRLKFSAVDKALIWWIISSAVTYTILWRTSGAFFNRMGLAYNAFGTYFLFRFLIRDFDDVVRIVKCLAVIAVPLSIAALVESSTGRNVFSVFGGVPELTPVRDGKVRSTFSFGDAILAGTFGATLMPLFLGMWIGRINRKLAFFGLVASTVITVISQSSGPVMAYVVEIAAFMMWPMRKRLRLVRWGAVTALLLLHMVMKAPVWALIGRLSEVVGGHGYDRVDLINSAIKYFGDWWLFGTKYTVHWGSTSMANDPNVTDMINQFIAIGADGGLITMLLFIAVVVYSFRGIGRAMRAAEGQPAYVRIFLWSMGVALVGHVASFMSVAYFSQLYNIWFIFLAMATSCEWIFYTRGVPAEEKGRVQMGAARGVGLNASTT